MRNYFRSCSGSCFTVMSKKLLLIVVMLAGGIPALSQGKSYGSPDKSLSAVIIPVGMKGYETYESRVEIRTSAGRLLRWRSFASPGHNHGEGVGHVQWSADGQFFVFNTFSSGGHQPWHTATYFYSRRANKFYSLDAFVGSITSDFNLEDLSTVVTTRFNFDKNEEKEPVRVRLAKLRAN